MTTFQYLVEGFLATLAAILPIPQSLVSDVSQHLLHWNKSSAELATLVSTVCAFYLVYFFRYDFLGLLSALLKSIVKPASLGSEQRSLDQHTLLFILTVFPFVFVGAAYAHPILREIEIFNSFPVRAVIYLGVALGLNFAKNWNKRIKGLNHLKLGDAFTIGALSLLASYDGISWLAILWIGFALTNYHFESIFKYSYILITVELVTIMLNHLRTTGFVESLHAVGYLNAIAVIVVSLTVVYMLMENLQRTMNEATYKNTRNWCILCALFYGVMVFI
ncbi:MAG: hypothetical protein JST80_02085 [Bdellovibrionales bacterium]|nr:hypothetical protein [Bdellovibrionales bacterium]